MMLKIMKADVQLTDLIKTDRPRTGCTAKCTAKLLQAINFNIQPLKNCFLHTRVEQNHVRALTDVNAFSLSSV